MDSFLDGDTLEQSVTRLGPFGPTLVVVLMMIAIVMSPIPGAPIALALGAITLLPLPGRRLRRATGQPRGACCTLNSRGNALRHRRGRVRRRAENHGNEEEAADVLHDFYVKVLTQIDDVRDTEKLRAWMHRVLETTLIDYYRAQSSRRRIERDYSYRESILLTDEYDLDFIICVCLYKLLPTLKAEYANILWRADLVGESRQSLAAALDITVSHLRVRLHRARQALRQRLEETCRTCPVHGYLDCQCDYGKHARGGIQQEPDAR